MSSRPALLLLVALGGCTLTSTPTPSVEPAATAAASYEVFPSTIPFGEKPEAILRNTGKVPLEYGHEFRLEWWTPDGRWQPLRQSTGAEPRCAFTLEALLLRPGESRSQKIDVCDEYGRTPPLTPGRYRVIKTVRTIASTPGQTPVEIKRIENFEVGEPSAPDLKETSRCRVLCLSDTRVRAGDVVQVSFRPPRRYIWGVGSEIHAAPAETLQPIGFLYGWQNKDKELTTQWPGEAGGEDIGFRGSDEWDWVVPERLEPGVYSIVKEGIRGGRGPLADRLETWTASFEVR